jgi:3-oxoacyl-[acyl-carrier-protein] synthase-3
MNTITAAITAVGVMCPDFVLSNKVLETMVDTMTSGLQPEQELKKEEFSG